MAKDTNSSENPAFEIYVLLQSIHNNVHMTKYLSGKLFVLKNRRVS